MSVGGGGKVGGPRPMVVPPQVGEGPSGKAAGKPVAADRFEKGGNASGVKPGTGTEAKAATDMLRLARENPQAAKLLAANMAAQATKVIADMGQEMAAAKAVLERLGAEKFGKKSLERHGKELRRRRDKLRGLKMRQQVGERRLALLQQIAGFLEDEPLEEELERLLASFGRLETDWGRRHHALGLGHLLQTATDEAPAELRGVVRATVKAGARAGEIGDRLHQASPQRAVSELLARTLDGSKGEAAAMVDEENTAVKRWRKLRDAVDEALGGEPLK